MFAYVDVVLNKHSLQWVIRNDTNSSNDSTVMLKRLEVSMKRVEKKK